MEFQDGRELDLSHQAGHSSLELYFARPLRPEEFDAASGASPNVFTDKGKLSLDLTSRYPPRADLAPLNEDDPSVASFAGLDPFDAVSQATPPGAALASFARRLPTGLAAGDYVLRVEVSEERDFNETYTEGRFPPPEMAFDEYGLPYRGQPSVLYEVPFVIAATDTRGVTLAYSGYSDPEALDGDVRPPDTTITTAALRLGAVVDAGETFRARVRYTPDLDPIAPGAPTAVEVTSIEGTTAELAFLAPGDDGTTGTVTRYEIRLLAGATITDASFASGTLLETIVVPASAGTAQTFALTQLSAGTSYSVGIRAFDDCDRPGPLAVVALETTALESGCGCSQTSQSTFVLGLLAFGWVCRASRTKRSASATGR